MIHLRLVVPPGDLDAVCAVLERPASVINIIVLPGAARSPAGDVVLCDVAREDASVVLSDLKALGLDERGSIAIERIDSALSRAARDAESAAVGAPSDAVVWEDVAARTSEDSTLSGAYLAFMVLASLIAVVAILLDSPVLLVGAMVVGPEFGPIAAFCVAAVQRRRGLAYRSLVAVVVGFTVAILAALVITAVFRWTGVGPDVFGERDHSLSTSIANPDVLALFVALCAGVAGVLSLTTAKSGALVGVAVSLTTIPAAANIGLAAVYGDWESWRGSLGQLVINLLGILVAGLATLLVQRRLFERRRARHLAQAVTPSSPVTTTPRSSS